MCDHCGCSDTAHAREHQHALHQAQHNAQLRAHDHETTRQVDVRQSILSHNDRLAEQNRGYFRARRVLVVNLLSGPGAGKTALIEHTVKAWTHPSPVRVIVGDLETENDADRIRGSGAQAVQITTGEACHLDAHMVQHALETLNCGDDSVLLIENVGNLVCPAAFDLGESARVVLMAVTDGEDKPMKYPVMFHRADLVIISKADLADAAEFRRELAIANIRQAAPRAEILEVSSKTGIGMDAWQAWLTARLPA
jgi:hydrogenase nickel incorporation protein HypB